MEHPRRRHEPASWGRSRAGCSSKVPDAKPASNGVHGGGCPCNPPLELDGCGATAGPEAAATASPTPDPALHGQQPGEAKDGALREWRHPREERGVSAGVTSLQAVVALAGPAPQPAHAKKPSVHRACAQGGVRRAPPARAEPRPYFQVDLAGRWSAKTGARLFFAFFQTFKSGCGTSE